MPNSKIGNTSTGSKFIDSIVKSTNNAKKKKRKYFISLKLNDNVYFEL
jgi:hypothetical protein